MQAALAVSHLLSTDKHRVSQLLPLDRLLVRCPSRGFHNILFCVESSAGKVTEITSPVGRDANWFYAAHRSLSRLITGRKSGS